MHETKHVSPSISSFTQSNVILHRVSWMNNVPRSRSSRLENRTTLLILLLPSSQRTSSSHSPITTALFRLSKQRYFRDFSSQAFSFIPSTDLLLSRRADVSKRRGENEATLPRGRWAKFTRRKPRNLRGTRKFIDSISAIFNRGRVRARLEFANERTPSPPLPSLRPLPLAPPRPVNRLGRRRRNSLQNSCQQIFFLLGQSLLRSIKINFMNLYEREIFSI